MKRDQPKYDVEHWHLNPGSLELAREEVHVWRAYIECERPVLGQLEATLSIDEKERANRFHSQNDRNRFVATRAILRELLGRYTNRAPADLEFDYGPQGKPALRKKSLSPSLQFNVSHSCRVALLAFSVGRRLGVDVEQVRGFVGEEIADRFFSPQEVEELRALPISLKDEGFFLCWTRKEAYVKASGEGLHVPLDSFHVTLTPGKPECLQSIDSLDWTLLSLCPDPEYAAALVGEGRGWNLRTWTWSLPLSA
jgi:4'-phosphopantetheinyl transferase